MFGPLELKRRIEAEQEQRAQIKKASEASRISGETGTEEEELTDTDAVKRGEKEREQQQQAELKFRRQRVYNRL